MDDEGLGFELVAASLRADTADSGSFLAALAQKVGGALPERTEVQYGGKLFGKKSISGLTVDLGDARYMLKQEHGRLMAQRQRVVRGIVLKNEAIPLDLWIEELSQGVAVEAQRSESGRAALQRMLEES